jgi:MYXO-CTERM domain-containing protein
VAMMRVENWTLCDGELAPTRAETLAERHMLCADERFADQPVVSRCSATLIDDDLVLTASHCMEDAECPTTLFAMGLYVESERTLNAITSEDVYACRRVVARPTEDVLVVELDRPVTGPYGPAPIATDPLEIGDAMAMVGFPSYGPMKIASGCEVERFVEGNFDTSCDGFRGNSGSGLFTASQEVAGVFVLGTGDFVPDGDCRRPQHYTDEGRPKGFPTAGPLWNRATYPTPALDLVCEMGWPARWCTELTATCGDGFCSGTETLATCAGDCTASTCGDGVCELATERECADCMHLAGCDPVPDAGVDAGTTVDAGSSTSDAGAIGDAGARDAGTITAPDPDDGCACSTSGHGSMATPIAALALMLVLRRRGRPRR